MLTKAHKAEAKRLRDSRPPVYEGTNLIADDKLREEWYKSVTGAMNSLGLTGKDRGRFCDLCGVPD